MYDIKPNLIIGFHGCEASVRDALLNNPNEIKISKKPFDWLGHGMYFWENNYERALQWAKDKKSRGAIKEPAVIGAVLYLGVCCDFGKIVDYVKHDVQAKGHSNHKIFDTTRGVFTEGGPAFPGAGLFAKSHIQICVRNPNCIQGFFMPRKELDFSTWLQLNKTVSN